MKSEVVRRFEIYRSLRPADGRSSSIPDEIGLHSDQLIEAHAEPESAKPSDWRNTVPFVWEREFTVLPPNIRFPRLPDGVNLRTDGIAFDLETTGLSGGSGTVAFLAGFASVREAGHILVHQLFLADYPGEPDFILAISNLLEKASESGQRLLSYNGAGFDLPLLRTRFIMVGQRPWAGDHRDLLHPVRRLWAACLPSCNLSVVERRLLGIVRKNDVPSAEVPGRYLESLRTAPGPDHPLLGPVFEHHAQDLISLLGVSALVSGIESAARLGMVPPWVARTGRDGITVDEFGLSRLMYNFEPEAAVTFLDKAFTNRNWSTERRVRAGLCLAQWQRRLDRWNEAVQIWYELWTDYGSNEAGLCLCKYFEHRLRDAATALTVASALNGKANLTPAERLSLSKRIERLVRITSVE